MTKWNSEIENAIIIIKKDCSKYKWLHNKMSSRYTLRHKILENVVTALGILTTGSAFTEISYKDENTWRFVITGILAFIATFVARHHSWANYQLQSREHKYIAGRWNNLYHSIKEQLLLDIEERQIASDYLSWVNSAYGHLIEVSPDISSSVLKSYSDLFDATSCSDSVTSDISSVAQEQIKSVAKNKSYSGNHNNSTSGHTSEIISSSTSGHASDPYGFGKAKVEDVNDIYKRDINDSTDSSTDEPIAMTTSSKTTDSLSDDIKINIPNTNNLRYDSARVKYELDRYFTDNIS